MYGRKTTISLSSTANVASSQRRPDRLWRGLTRGGPALASDMAAKWVKRWLTATGPEAGPSVLVRGANSRGRKKLTGGALAGLRAGRIGHDQRRQRAQLHPLRDRQGPEADHLAGIRRQDAGAEHAASRDDKLDQAGGVPFGGGAVIVGERPAQDGDAMAGGARLGLGHADLRQLGLV